MKFFRKKEDTKVNKEIKNENNYTCENDEYSYDYNSTPEEFNYNQNSENSSYNYDYSESNQSYDYYNYSSSYDYDKSKTDTNEKKIDDENNFTDDEFIEHTTKSSTIENQDFTQIKKSEFEDNYSSNNNFTNTFDDINNFDDETFDYDTDEDFLDEKVDSSEKTYGIDERIFNDESFNFKDKTKTNIKIKKKSIDRKFSWKIVIASSITLFILNGIISSVGHSAQTSKILKTFPYEINDFTVEKIVLGELSDGRNVYLQELPMKMPYSEDVENSICIENIFKDEIIFYEDNIPNETNEYKDFGPLQIYNFNTGEFRILLDTSNKYYHDVIANDKYIVVELYDQLYIYNKLTNISEYISSAEFGEYGSAGLKTRTVLVDEYLYYNSEEVIYSYHIPTREKKALTTYDFNHNYYFDITTDEYLVLKKKILIGDTTESYLIDIKNNSEMILLEDNLEVNSLIDNEDSLLFLDANSDEGTIDMKFDKATKSFEIIDEELYGDMLDNSYSTAFKDLVFKTSYSNPLAFTIISPTTKESVIFDLSEYIDTPKYLDFEIYDYGVFIETKIDKSQFSRQYFISVGKEE